jgi:uncharacterized membrane protein
VLAVLIPLLVAAILIAERWNRVTHRPWLTVPLAAAFLLVSGLIAQQSGSREEERVEAIVPESAIETHEERAETFVWMSAAALVIGLAAAIVRRDRARQGLQWLTLAASLAVAGMALRVGHSGGDLVYVHGAAAAYVDRAPAASASEPLDANPDDHSDRGDGENGDRE